MPSITLAVTLTAANDAILRERANIVTERIRKGMFGCDAPGDPNSWPFTIAELELDHGMFIVATSANDDNDGELHAAFTTLAKAEDYIAAEFDPESEVQPYTGVVALDPTPAKKEFVTIWHTCIDIQSGTFGEKGKADRHDASDPELSSDEEYVTQTFYRLGYANVRSRVSAEDSIRRAEALRARELAKLVPSRES
jgi:hypothetical protein